MADSRPMAVRRRRAWASVAGGAALVAGLCLFSSMTAEQAEPSVRGVDAAWDALYAGASEAQAAEACGVAVSTVPPDWFSEEVPCAGMTVVYADEGWTLVRMDAAGAPDQMMERFRIGLEGAGWTYMESGCEGLGTFAKTEGRCSWLMIESAEAGDGASAVLHILHD